ncbi:MAG: phosphoribosylamine--glycine ligase [Kiritimatiellia bacterium]|jgi:phosphoribosylamine--glycine ligase|nr:phosphoribosylamine--glycine ligase [Kiritimatiellia bacterium]MDP6847665.1 phosphoribosylamine--glycine ligase [Kiritimatiellia bacterium]
MKILVIGGGGREHAITWKLANDSCKPELFCAPGNAGTARIATNIDVGAEDCNGLLEWARTNRPDLTVVGPEVPLCAGIADVFAAEGLAVFGPSGEAAQMEGSKAFAKDVMTAAGVPTAASETFTDAEAALSYIREKGTPIVVKADGLAAGKGVIICETVADAEKAIASTILDKTFGDAGATIIVEECLVGEEASILALVDGETIVTLASSQDHKRVFNGDVGPNTGGMGAYSPAPVVTDDMWPEIRAQVLDPTIRELKKRGITYKGVLYAGLMLTEAGMMVLEFNCRFGDPETQAVLPRLGSDLTPALQACVDGTLSEEMVTWKPDACVSVVMASGGYPGPYEKGKTIEGLDAAEELEGVVVFHAGTKEETGEVVTSGGRVLGVTALGRDLSTAVDAAYSAVAQIRFDQAQYRTDIAARALPR